MSGLLPHPSMSTPKRPAGRARILWATVSTIELNLHGSGLPRYLNWQDRPEHIPSVSPESRPRSPASANADNRLANNRKSTPASYLGSRFLPHASSYGLSAGKLTRITCRMHLPWRD